MDHYCRTDLAAESFEQVGRCVNGVEHTTQNFGGYTIHRTLIFDEDAAKLLGKPLGEYVTIECGIVQHLTHDESNACAEILAGELHGLASRLLGRVRDSELSVLAVGLGNAELTADAIGPMTVSKLTATRHLKEHETELYLALGCSSLSILAPGVLGQTGIEALELLRNTVESVHPDLILVIDALAAASCERLATTIQFSNVGIVPGSGVGNHRNAITQETVGVPVISIGVPTVVDSTTLVFDTLKLAEIEETDDFMQKVLENRSNFFVSPKESDVIVSHFSKLIAKAIELAFVGELPF